MHVMCQILKTVTLMMITLSILVLHFLYLNYNIMKNQVSSRDSLAPHSWQWEYV